jgi:APA family basic amino acid/polyamine antiporter
MNQPVNAGLIRGIRRWDLVAVAINGIIGAGIFGLPSKVFAQVGAYSLIAFAACALVVTLIIVCFAEVGSRFTETGGPYLYAREAFGPVVGFEVGWLMWLARVTAFAANCNLFVGYLSYFWPAAGAGPARVAIIVAVVALLGAVNIIGVRDAAMVSNFFTVGKLLPIIFFIAVGSFFIAPENFSFDARPSFGAFSTSVLLLIYAFTGFEMAVIPAGEVSDPRRNLPLAILTAIAVVAVLYISIQVVSVGTLPELATSERPLADASQRFLGAAGASIISAGALVSIFGNLNVLILAGSRLPFAMAEHGELPRAVSATHARFRTPHFAIVLTCALMLALTLSGTFIYAATVSAIARLLAYAGTCAALPVLRKGDDRRPAMFKAPGGVFVAAASLLLIAWLLYNSTWREARDAGIAAAAGLAIYLAYRLYSAARARRVMAEEMADEQKA